MTPSEAITSGRARDGRSYTVVDADPADGTGRGLYDAVALVADIEWDESTEMGLVDDETGQEVWRGTIRDAIDWCDEFRAIESA